MKLNSGESRSVGDLGYLGKFRIEKYEIDHKENANN